MAKIDALSSASLVASALTPTHRYGPSTTAAKRTQEAAAKAATAFTNRSSNIDAAPGRTGSAAKKTKTITKSTNKSKKTNGHAIEEASSLLSTYDDADFSPRTRRRAAVVGEKKRKREGGSEEEYEDDEDDDEEEDEEDLGEEDLGIQTRPKKRRSLAPRQVPTTTTVSSMLISVVEQARAQRSSPKLDLLLQPKSPTHLPLCPRFSERRIPANCPEEHGRGRRRRYHDVGMASCWKDVEGHLRRMGEDHRQETGQELPLRSLDQAM